jgi:hypothetical protein
VNHPVARSGDMPCPDGASSPARRESATISVMTNTLVTVVYAALGLGFAGMGVPLALGRIRPGSSYGFRTAKTLSSPAIWYAANRVQGIDLCVAGLLVAAAAVLLFVGARAVPPALLAAADTAILSLSLIAVAAHGAAVLRRL